MRARDEFERVLYHVLIMEQRLSSAVESSIADATGEPTSKIISFRPVGGGCINHAGKIELADGRIYFLKSNSDSPPTMFRCEAAGLMALAKAKAVVVPQVIACGQTGTTRFLILEWIESAARRPDFSQQLGRQLAAVHQTQTADQFGFATSNFLGSTAQPNGWRVDWVEFWAENRLGHQLRLAQDGGLGGPQLQKLGQRLLDRLPGYLDIGDERPSLIHGDLWSGNYLAGPQGEPVLIDPAVYFGHREAEFGMTTLFGGFDDDFYAAYNEFFPMAENSFDRIAVYRLYHLLNHLNLFGTGYLNGCLDILKKYA